MSRIKINYCGHKTIYVSEAWLRKMGANFRFNTPREIPLGIPKVCDTCDKMLKNRIFTRDLLEKEFEAMEVDCSYSLEPLNPVPTKIYLKSVLMSVLVQHHLDGTLDNVLQPYKNRYENGEKIIKHVAKVKESLRNKHKKVRMTGYILSKRLYNSL